MDPAFDEDYVHPLDRPSEADLAEAFFWTGFPRRYWRTWRRGGDAAIEALRRERSGCEDLEGEELMEHFRGLGAWRVAAPLGLADPVDEITSESAERSEMRVDPPIALRGFYGCILWDREREVLVSLSAAGVRLAPVATSWVEVHLPALVVNFAEPIPWTNARDLRRAVDEVARVRRELYRRCYFCNEPFAPEHGHTYAGVPTCHGCMEIRGTVF